jgi:hypothetical protein
LGKFYEKRLQANGLNVEGLAVVDGQMFFGLRAPNLDGDSLMLKVSAECVFDAGPCGPKLIRLVLGAGLGNRALEPWAGGFLVIAGPATPKIDGQTVFSLWH